MTLGDRIVVMKDGLIQQVGTPLEVYNSPSNRFVAGFVGTPPMNFFEGKLTSANGATHFDEGTAGMRLTNTMATKLQAWLNKDVVMGVRPEAMSLHGEGRFKGEDNVLPMQVNVIEPLG